MTNKRSILLLAIVLSQSVFAQTNLENCINLAYKNYPQIKEKDLIEESRKFDLDNASTSWIPQLTISGKASWQSSVIELPWDVPGMSLDIPHDQYGITADLTQQIWDGGASSIKKQLIEAGASVSNEQLNVNLYAIRSRVQNIYLGIKLIDKQLELNKLLGENLERTASEIQSLIKGGVAYGTDLDQVKVNILSCRQQKESLQTDRKAYVKMLSLLTGTDFSGASFADIDEGKIRTGNISDISRPELAMYNAQVKQAELKRKQLDVNLYPKFNLNLQGGYGRPGLNMMSGKFEPYFIASIKFQWNIGSFYTLKTDRNKADADVRRVDLARQSFLLNTSMEAAQKQSEIEKIEESIKTDEEIIRLRSGICSSAQLQYKQGVITMNEYLNLMDEEFKARANLNIHKVQHTMAVLDLQNTLGHINQYK